MRCPVCKAQGNVGPNCRRCKADLSLLLALEQQREQLLQQACVCVRQGDWPGFAARAAQADSLRHDAESGRLVALARLLDRDFAAAWQAWRSLADH
jgi:hypothetical protein